MKLCEFSVENYKCFSKKETVQLGPGFNVIVGTNNSGKTSLLEAMSLQFRGRPHRSTSTVPRPTSAPFSKSMATVTMKFSRDELMDVWLQNVSTLTLPVPAGYPMNAGDAYLAAVDQKHEFAVQIQKTADSGSSGWAPTRFPSEISIEAEGSGENRPYFVYVRRPEGFSFTNPVTMAIDSDPYFHAAQALSDRIYVFRAERFALGESAFGAATLLSPNAENLAEVLHMLQTTKPAAFRDLLILFREIFPGVADLSVRPISGTNRQEIVLWSEAAATGRSDLAFTLSESGTGLGQVLSMLYVVLTADFPRVVIIDEPNSFLNPSVSRKLIEILSEYKQHQYIISTHSPEIIKAAAPETVILVKRDGPRSVLEQRDAEALDTQQACLQLLGVRLSDVFGADRVLWVEGATEEVAFPSLLAHSMPVGAHVTVSVLAVRSASEVQGRKRRLDLVLDIYRRLTSGGSLVPPTLAFLFDSEGLTEKEKGRVVHESAGLVRFIPRRMYENYLLDPIALAAVLAKRETFAASPPTAEIVRDWIESNGARFSKGEDPIFSDGWLRSVHGADLLDRLFADLSGERERYEKIVDGKELTRLLIDRDPGRFSDLTGMLQKILASSASPVRAA